jgi:uncharacterized SAM-binding protein YcdF (DUF218 family)
MSDFWRKTRWPLLISILVLAALVAFHAPILRGVGLYLISEDTPRKAAAIVALRGQVPFRELEAAKYYREGFAPIVILVPSKAREEALALDRLGIKVTQDWQYGREVLVKQGVPPAAIVVAKGEGEGTLEELRAAYDVVANQDAPVILVTSKYHTRRTRLTWQFVTRGRSEAIVRAAAGDPFDPSRWWKERRFALSVVREYLGLVNYYAGFPVAP